MARDANQWSDLKPQFLTSCGHTCRKRSTRAGSTCRHRGFSALHCWGYLLERKLMRHYCGLKIIFTGCRESDERVTFSYHFPLTFDSERRRSLAERNKEVPNGICLAALATRVQAKMHERNLTKRGFWQFRKCLFVFAKVGLNS